MISAVMLTGENNPTLARDTMFSVLMIVLNGMLGLTLLIGGMRHHEQEYNLPGARAYLGVLFDIVLLTLTLLVSIVNFGTLRTNVLQGAVHLILFISYVILIFD